MAANSNTNSIYSLLHILQRYSSQKSLLS